MTPETVIPEHELPDWMRRARLGVDWGVLLVLLLGFVAAGPLWQAEGLPRARAIESTLFRAADTAEALREGRLYPRWSPYAQQGYGAPIPHYAPPGAAYATALLDLLFTNDMTRALRLLMVLAFVMGGAFTYAWVSRLSEDAAAGLIAALIYLFNPLVVLIVPYQLGDVDGLLALMVLPGLWWSAARLAQRRHPLDVLGVALLSAALGLTAPSIALLGGLMALALYAFMGFRRRISATALLDIALALLLGAGLAAFYWLPAALESELVGWRAPDVMLPLSAPTFGSLFQMVPPVDPGALLARWPLSLGPAVLILAALTLAWNVRQRLVDVHVWALMLGALTLFVLVLSVTYVQDSVWLGLPAALLAAGCAGVVRWRHGLPAWGRRALFVAVLVFVLGLANPVWLAQIPRLDQRGTPDAMTQIRYEQQGFGVPTLPPWSPLPSGLAPGLEANRALINGFQTGALNRLLVDALAPGTEVNVLTQATHRLRYGLNAASESLLTLLLAYFPGWQATLDGQAIPVSAEADTGLMQAVAPPARDGALLVQLAATPVRLVAWGVTWASLLVVAIWATWRIRRGRAPGVGFAPRLAESDTRLLVVVMAGWLLIAGVYQGPFAPSDWRTPVNHHLAGSQLLRYRTPVGLEAFAFRLSSTRLTPGETLDVSVYWRTSRFLTRNYEVSLALRDVVGGRVMLRSAPRSPGHYPTRRWRTDVYVADRYPLTVPDLPPGHYVLTLRVRPACDEPCSATPFLSFFDFQGRLLGTLVTLPQRLVVVDEAR